MNKLNSVMASFLIGLYPVCVINSAYAENDPASAKSFLISERVSPSFDRSDEAALEAYAPSSRAAILVSKAAAKHGIPSRLAHAIIKIESNYSCYSHSSAGARGIAQVLPATARAMGVHGNLYDCATGLEAGMRYLRLALDMHGYGCAGLSAYERGVYAPSRCTAYGRRALRLAKL